MTQKSQFKGFDAFVKYWKADAKSGIWVSLFSFPFLISIAFASNFPFFSAFITASVGALVIGQISQSPLTVKDVGLSMIPLIWLAVEGLSKFTDTGIGFALAVICLAGVFQMILGLLKVGNWHNIFPEAIIYGLLTAVGLMIIIHQIYFFIGVTPNPNSTSIDLLLGLPNAIYDINTEILILSLVSFFILSFVVEYDLHKVLPAAFLVILIGLFFTWYFELYKVDNQMYLFEVSKTWKNTWVFPDFSKIFIWKSIELAFLIALFCSLESLINLKNIEVLDTQGRRSKPNRELIYLGLGNIACGLLGGLPLLVNVSASSVNVNHNAKTASSHLFKVLFLGLLLLALYPILKYLPLASMAVLLIYTAYRLNSPKLFNAILEIGREQVVIFSATVIFTISIGIFAGILGGIITTFLVYLWLGTPYQNIFKAKTELNKIGKYKTKIDIKGAALASNYWSIQKAIRQVDSTQRLILDFADAKVIDHSFQEQVYQYANLNGLTDGQLELQGLKNHRAISKHPLSTLYFVKKKKNYIQRQQSLDERQIDLRAVAAVNNAQLETNLTYDGIVLQDFEFAFGYEIKYRENKFICFYHNSTIEFSDVFLSKGIRMHEQNHKMSVLLATVMDMPVPNFSLSKEGLLQKVQQRMGQEDIDFEEHPVFSEKYTLLGEDKERIKSLFQNELCLFLEQHQVIHIESKNNRLLVYKDRDLLEKTELEDLIIFTESFIDIIHQKEYNLA